MSAIIHDTNIVNTSSLTSDDAKHVIAYRYKYSITGKAAHGRLKNLLPQHWKDCSPYATTSTRENEVSTHDKDEDLHFIWENSPRHETKKYRNSACCYSHLPNGIGILDDKWVLGRIFSGAENKVKLSNLDPYFTPLETHCFRGKSGLQLFSDNMRCSQSPIAPSQQLIDLDPEYNVPSKQKHISEPGNLWVIKDANANGYGGIWVMNINHSSSKLLDQNASPLQENHRYVAQRYAWPPTLWQGKKFHVRVYAVMMNGRAYVHKRCFLHVANEEFECRVDQDNDIPTMKNQNGTDLDFDPAVHITNCCANSHDTSKFAGEILADFDLKELALKDGCGSGQTIVPLNKYFKSVAASVKALAEKTATFVQGGEKNRGFEYLGLDFILSQKTKTSKEGNLISIPTAYLLEVNCPPSQDTATGLPYAEDLHDEVIKDLLKMWVIPNVNQIDGCPIEPSKTYGWRCVYSDYSTGLVQNKNFIEPSKATILNKIRWAFFERRAQRATGKNEEQEVTEKKGDDRTNPIVSAGEIGTFAREHFSFFQKNRSSQSIFLENAGGSQVPDQVINCMVESLSHRHRSIIGNKSKEEARKMSMTLLGGYPDRHIVFLGANSSHLFGQLARLYVKSKFLSSGDELVLASENHLANVKPWIEAAREIGGRILWWTSCDLSQKIGTFSNGEYFAALTDFNSLLSANTRLVCLSHSSNILAQLRDIKALCRKVRQQCPRAHIVVDGVAACPHSYAAVDDLGVDFYCVSYHKFFGPHIGAMIGRKDAIDDIVTKVPLKNEKEVYQIFESGTLNYEGCNGINGVGNYFAALGSFGRNNESHEICKASKTGEDSTQNPIWSAVNRVLCAGVVKEAYHRISVVEKECLDYVIEKLRQCKNVRIIGNCHDLPIIAFVHSTISSQMIVEWCSRHQVIIRCGSFLTTEILQAEFNIGRQCNNDDFGGIVRISFCHYNTLGEAHKVVDVLQSMNEWNC